MPPKRRRQFQDEEETSASRRQNHVAAEKKRREAIRQGFDRITAVVPELTHNQSRSEALVLKNTLACLKYLLEENEALRKLAKDNELPLPEPLN